jgi:hypothetical protein
MSEQSMSFVRANVLGGVFFVVAAAAILLAHSIIHSVPVTTLMAVAIDAPLLPVFAVFAAGVLIHEVLHAAAFIAFGKAPVDQVKIGIKWKYLTPYANCRTAMTARAYRISAALPGIVLGIVPALIGILFDWQQVAVFGAVFLGAAGGDALILWITRGLHPDRLVRDSEQRIGCEVVGEAENVTA